MRVVVLGRSGSFPRAGEACSGYLVEAEDRVLLVDCGHGVVSRLLQRLDVYRLGGLILTHMHPDHVADVPALRLALEWSCFPPEPWQGRLATLAPQEAADYLTQVTRGPQALRVFDLKPIQPHVTYELCGFRVRFVRAQHPVETYAVRIEDAEGALAYTADTAYDEAVAELARGADLLLAECTFPDDLEDRAREVGHLTPRGVGRLAASAGVRCCVLTHLFPTLDPEAAVQGARVHFPHVVCATELRAYEVGGRNA